MNLVIISCAIHTTTSSSCFSDDIRIEQMQNTMRSIMNKIPDAYTVILETGSATQEQKNKISRYSNEYHTQNVTNLNKNTGEATMLYRYLQSDAFKAIVDKLETINKVSGRYFLNDNFNFNRFSLETIIVKHRLGEIGEHLFETRYYRFPRSHLPYFFEKLESIMTSPKKELEYDDVEHLFYKYDMFPINKTHYNLGFTQHDRIGIAGWVAGDGKFIED